MARAECAPPALCASPSLSGLASPPPPPAPATAPAAGAQEDEETRGRERVVVLRCAVEDTGVGIIPEHAALLFREAFVNRVAPGVTGASQQQRSDELAKVGIKSSGLGLGIAKGLVQAMGGAITIHSDGPNRGSTFSFTLRVPVASGPLPPTPDVPLPIRRPAHSLSPADGCAPSPGSMSHASTTGADLSDAECDDGDTGAATDATSRVAAASPCSPATTTTTSASADEEQHSAAPSLPPPCAVPPLSPTMRTPCVGAAPPSSSQPAAHDGGAPGASPENTGLPAGRESATKTKSMRRARSHQAMTARSPAAEAGEGGAAPTPILVADDDPVNRMVMSGLLQRLGFEQERDFDVVTDGCEAVEAAQKRRYRLVLMDIQMPRMDGLEATRRILASSFPSPSPDAVRPPPLSVPLPGSRLSTVTLAPAAAMMLCAPFVCALSAGVLAEEKGKCFEAGASAFVAKPYKATDIREVIRIVSQTAVA